MQLHPITQRFLSLVTVFSILFSSAATGINAENSSLSYAKSLNALPETLAARSANDQIRAQVRQATELGAVRSMAVQPTATPTPEGIAPETNYLNAEHKGEQLIYLPIIAFGASSTTGQSPQSNSPSDEYQTSIASAVAVISDTLLLTETRNLLNKDLVWYKLPSSKEIFALPNDTTIVADGAVYRSGLLWKKTEAKIMDYYFPQSMAEKGWKFINGGDGPLVMVLEYTNSSSGKFMRVRIVGRPDPSANEPTSTSTIPPATSVYFEVAIYYLGENLLPFQAMQEQSQEQSWLKPLGNVQTVTNTDSVERGAITVNAVNAPFFSQQDSTWSGDPQGFPDNGYPTACNGSTIRLYGCWVTTHAMLYSYYQSGYTNPKNLNNLLNNANNSVHYAHSSDTNDSNYHCNNIFPWAAYKPANVAFNGAVYNQCTSPNCFDTDKVGNVNNYLDSGKPLALYVHYSGIYPQHMVLLTGHSGSTYYIQDPWDTQQQSRTLSNGALGAYTVDYIHFFSGSQSQPTPTPGSTPTPVPTSPPPTPTSSGAWAYRLFALGDLNGEKFESNQTYNDLATINKNDWAQSLQVNAGWGILACSDANFHGTCARATGPAEYRDINALAQGLRNGLSSIQVCSGSCPEPTPIPTATAQPPTQPVLVSPADGATLSTDSDITLIWNSVNGANEYAVELWGPTVKQPGRQAGTSFHVGQLSAGAYKWQVEAYNAAGWSGWAQRTFTVSAPATPTPVSTPTNTSVPPTPTLPTPTPAIWAYRLFALGDFNGEKFESSQTYNDLATINKNDWAQSLQVNAGYGILACVDANFHGVCARATGPAQFADINALAEGLRNGLSSIQVCPGSCPDPTPIPTATAQPPTQPVLVSPAAGASFSTNSDITLVWSSVNGANEYAVELWGPVVKQPGRQAGTSYHVGQLPVGNYVWQVEAYNAAGWSGWSPQRAFTVSAPATPTSVSTPTNTAVPPTATNANTPVPPTATVPTPTPVQPPGQPVLLSPVAGASLSTNSDITLIWNPVNGANEYAVELWGPVVKQPGRQAGTSFHVGQLPVGNYVWQVEAYNAAGWSGWSPQRAFTVSAPATPTNTAVPPTATSANTPVPPTATNTVVPPTATIPTPTPIQPPALPVLLSPVAGASFSTNSDITLVWNSVNGANEYAVELWGPISKQPGRQSGTSFHVGQLPAGNYVWKVEAYNTAGWSGWSPERPFTVSEPATPIPTNTLAPPTATNTEVPPTPTIPTPTPVQPPGPPVLVSPIDGVSLSTGSDITLVWNAVNGANEYAVELWGPVSKQPGRQPGTTFHVGQLPSGDYTWQVEAYNAAGWSGWVSRHFTVVVSQPTPTPTAGADVISADNFESGSIATWWVRTNPTNLSVVAPTPLLVGAKSLQVTINSNTATYLTDETPSAEKRYRARFYFDPNTIKMKSGNAHYIFYGYSGPTTVVLRVEFGFASGKYQLRAGLVNDTTTWKTSSWATITDAPHWVELDWQASASSTAKNGSLTFWIDGVQKGSLTKIDNDTRRVDNIKLGAVDGIDTGTRGAYYFDAFESHRQNPIGAASSGVAALAQLQSTATDSVDTVTNAPASFSTVSVQAGADNQLSVQVDGLRIQVNFFADQGATAVTASLAASDNATSPDGYTLLGNPFAIRLDRADGAPANTNGQPLTIQINYGALSDRIATPAHLSLQMWNGEAERWEIIPATINPVDQTVTAKISQPATLALWASEEAQAGQIYLPVIQQ